MIRSLGRDLLRCCRWSLGGAIPCALVGAVLGFSWYGFLGGLTTMALFGLAGFVATFVLIVALLSVL
ncbi:MAG: hypothetical protein H6807_17480 [Planctomycetes bacterium]|nr:hypothetical protein [Planctomycetota bacterium]